MNWILMATAIVLLFRSSNALASTYGISVSTTMVVTTMATDLAASLPAAVTMKHCVTTYHVGRPSPVSGRGRLDGMAAWRDRLFSCMKRNSADVTAEYKIPNEDIIEMGLKVAI